MEVERVLAEETKERQAKAGGDKSSKAYLSQAIDNKGKAVVEKIPQAGVAEPESKSRDRSASIVGNTNARYEGARLAGLVVLTTDTARKIIFRAHILIKIAHIVSFHIWLQGVYELLPKWKPLLKVHLLD